ncbi:MAG TPA: hypothetical protein VI911_10000 [Patescibacteria group bacterium]|nr:hypothetical protein [Patescibacteria group bacterium]
MAIQVMYDMHLNNLDFMSEVNFIISQYDIEDIVETGTNVGLGSTQVLARTGLDVATIECNPQNHAQAVENLKAFSNVSCHLGFSMHKQRMLDFIKNDKYTIPKDIAIDSHDPLTFYSQELNFNVDEELLDKFSNNNKKQLLFLDSAGGVGYMEFLYVMNLKPEYQKNKVILMDDCTHVKHFRSVIDLEKQSIKVTKILNDRVCWAKL